MATHAQFKAKLGLRLPGKVRPGSHASFRKGATLTARADMSSIIERYNELISHFEQATPEILENALQPAFDRSQEYVPRDTGALAESGVLEVDDSDPARAEATITYGNAETWYAALVHELTNLNHEYPTRSKYLQAALEECIDEFLVNIAVDYALLMS